MSSSSDGNAPRSALRQRVLITCAVAALFTAVSTSVESQRFVASVASSTPASSQVATPSVGETTPIPESCRAR